MHAVGRTPFVLRKKGKLCGLGEAQTKLRDSKTPLSFPSPLLPALLAIKAREPREQEDRPIRLLLDLRAPIPRTRQATINAASRIEEIVRARAVEPMLEEI